METTLHKQLKEMYSDDSGKTEVRLGRFRIDAVNGNRLVEIQHSGLGAIRDKIKTLLKSHVVDVVKPIVAKKRIVRLDKRNGVTVSERWSPSKGTLLDIFEELLHFTQVFPHKKLRLLVPLVVITETRFPGHGKRRRWRANDFVVEDQRLDEIVETHQFQSKNDLAALLPLELPTVFDTAELAAALALNRSDAQRIAYVLRETGTSKQIGKAGNRLLYRLAKTRAKTATRKSA